MVVDAEPGISGTEISAGNLFSRTQVNSADVNSGKIEFVQLTEGSESFSGSGAAASIAFKALKKGTATLNFDFALGATTDSNVAKDGSDILKTVGKGTFVISSSQLSCEGAGGKICDFPCGKYKSCYEKT